MRSWCWVFVAILLCGSAAAQDRQAPESSPSTPTRSSAQDTGEKLPVSVDRIRAALEQQPTRSLFSALPAEQPTFRIDVKEKNRLQELVASLDFKSGRTPAGGLYAAEQQRIMFPTTSNPLQQPYAAFSQSELLTVLVENLAGKYLVGKALGAITGADRARAESAARDEVHQAIAQYCAAQPGAGTGIAICTPPSQ
jgi:hypothetical protein